MSIKNIICPHLLFTVEYKTKQIILNALFTHPHPSFVVDYLNFYIYKTQNEARFKCTLVTVLYMCGHSK